MADSVFSSEEADFRIEDGAAADDMGPMRAGQSSRPADTSDQGPCLYLGPAGQRCSQRAVKGGFCALHQPGALARAKIAKPAKVLAAIAGALGVLWPYIYVFVHELLRLIHPR